MGTPQKLAVALAQRRYSPLAGASSNIRAESGAVQLIVQFFASGFWDQIP